MIVLALMAIVCAIADSVLEKKFYPEGAPWLFRDDQSDDNPSINGLVTWAFALITLVFNYPLIDKKANNAGVLDSRTSSLYLFISQ